MDTPTLRLILSRTPEARLKLLELAGKPVKPAWQIQNEERLELEQAVDEAERHIAATRRLHRTMRRIMMRPGG